ncbi:hypothetical protein EIN_177980 [Entamoeba invadens IP1]|uniref:hypothetical protein n=1 Tax=Entamoeba invadens IP1 TaxID=370355 RepID=UPI0002C3F45F|nr:hypothetical protein EIN_177980 [Entamoeba invadens IP1]ELP93891.1 hypothetical protein EIN_177980 [Entamoeba invadens IP1]|eukprot:XP_004260662.1 hypothetical protein EIN_177980 [Entamoeba invadens IP1]
MSVKKIGEIHVQDEYIAEEENLQQPTPKIDPTYSSRISDPDAPVSKSFQTEDEAQKAIPPTCNGKDDTQNLNSQEADINKLNNKEEPKNRDNPQPTATDVYNIIKQFMKNNGQLFLLGISSYRKIRAVLTRFYRNSEKFKMDYYEILKINVFYMFGYTLLCYFLGFIPQYYPQYFSPKFLTFCSVVEFITANTLLMYALYISEKYYYNIAVNYDSVKNKGQSIASHSYLYSFYFSILTSMLLGATALLRVLHFSMTSLFLLSILYAFYAFNLKFRLHTNWNLAQMVSLFDSRLMFFFGFALPFTSLSFFCSTLVSNALYALLFPVLVGLAIEEHPEYQEKTARIPVLTQFLNLLNIVNNFAINLATVFIIGDKKKK